MVRRVGRAVAGQPAEPGPKQMNHRPPVDHVDHHPRPQCEIRTPRLRSGRLRVPLRVGEPGSRGSSADLSGLAGPGGIQKLAELPEELQREVFTAFRLEILYDARLGVALIRITLHHETIKGVAAMAEELRGNEPRRLPEAGACAEDLVSAPGEGPRSRETGGTPSELVVRARQLMIEAVRPLPQRRVRTPRAGAEG